VATGLNSIRNKARVMGTTTRWRTRARRGPEQAKGAATTRALEFEEWCDTPPEAVFKPRQRVS
jgi:hypothetical protein